MLICVLYQTTGLHIILKRWSHLTLYVTYIKASLYTCFTNNLQDEEDEESQEPLSFYQKRQLDFAKECRLLNIEVNSPEADMLRKQKIDANIELARTNEVKTNDAKANDVNNNDAKTNDASNTNAPADEVWLYNSISITNKHLLIPHTFSYII